MSELRRDPVLGRWVVIAPDRVRQLAMPRLPLPAAVPPESCPFCPGHEELTPPEVHAVRPEAKSPNTPGWTLRVIPNNTPALRVEGELNRQGEGLYDRMNGIGAHEIVIETPEHGRDMADMSVDDVAAVLWAWSERIRDLSGDLRLTAAAVFRNYGIAGVSSVVHPHSQIVALPVVPQALVDEIEGGAAHYRNRERCVWCDVIRQERKDSVRLVLENEDAIVLCPWAARVPFECQVLPVRHASTFEEETAATVRSMAEALQETLRRLKVALDAPPYMLALHSAPLRERGLAHYHWHIEILPRLAPSAGFEWGAGSFINPVAPEEAAAILKKLRG
jgi:UDPglucose--hexose-1-phosphate uridylyltransferase